MEILYFGYVRICSDVDVVGDCAKLIGQDVGAEPIRNHLAGRFWPEADARAF